jgi:elongator complex protein 5
VRSIFLYQKSDLNISKGSLIIIDTLHPLLTHSQFSAPSFLSSLTTPTTSLLLTYHTDIPLHFSPTAPHPLTLLRYLATTIFQLHSFHHILAQKAARERSHAEPVFGLHEETEGVVVGLGANDRRGVVLDTEYRRKSGRGVREWFFLPSPASSAQSSTSTTPVPSPFFLKKPVSTGRETVILLEDHPLYARPVEDVIQYGDEEAETTFNLGLTEKQRRDREGIVLPYFDAQGEGGVGEGGRILYDMGEEDDFDEEEDEI